MNNGITGLLVIAIMLLFYFGNQNLAFLLMGLVVVSVLFGDDILDFINSFKLKGERE